MSELDAFESRFSAAYRRYLDTAPRELDAAAVVRTVTAAHPRSHPFAWPRALRPAQALAWIVLLALLATLLVAAAAIVARLPQPVGSVCPPGSAPDKPGPAAQARPNSGWMWTFDRRAGSLVVLAGGEPGTDLAAETWTFDVCANTWARMYPDREPPPGLNQLVYDVDSDLTIGSDGGRMWVYDLDANTWTEKGSFAQLTGVAALEFYDPVSGLVVARGPGFFRSTLGLALWSYEVETGAWTPIPVEQLTIGPHYEFFAYDTSVDRLVAWAETWQADGMDWTFEAKAWLFDIRTGTWSGTDAVAPQFDNGMWGLAPGIAYDEAAQRTVMMGQGHSAAYDATADRWETLWTEPSGDDPCGTRPECRQMPGMLYDSVNGRLIVHGGSVNTGPEWVDPDDMLAFDTRTGEWTVLLEGKSQ